jgi:light-regulated signal transduction histidine kinase (bacteriophytochrome)
LIDVSERARAEAKIRNANAQLESRVAARTAELRQSNAELREFAYTVSHDLQAPLKQAEKRLQELGSKVRDSDGSGLLQQTQADLRRMSSLIENMLSFAMAANRIPEAGGQVPIAIAVEESLLNLASTIAASHAVVAYDNLPEIRVDEADFVQLFQNLIGNALKYRSSDPPRIRITAARGVDSWTIAVRDNGIGIDPADRENIFEPFRRLHRKEYPGTGIGLAICKKIVERAGGKIWVDSQPGRGSTVRFTIPV